MNNRETIQNELETLQSSLPAGVSGEAMNVPEGYFESLPLHLLRLASSADASAREETELLSPLLADRSKHTPYQVPAGYFEENTARLQSYASEPQLPGVSRKNVYTVPTGYFENLPAAVLKKVTQPSARIVTMSPATRWVRMAAAAVIGGALCIAGYQYAAKSSNTPVQPVAFNPSVSQVASADPALVQEIKKLPTEELTHFVQTVQPTVTGKTNTTAAPVKDEVQTMLKDVPAAEMENFLADLPSAEDETIETNLP